MPADFTDKRQKLHHATDGLLRGNDMSTYPNGLMGNGDLMGYEWGFHRDFIGISWNT